MIPLRRQLFLKLYRIFDLVLLSLSYVFNSWILSSQKKMIFPEGFVNLKITIKEILFFVCFLFLWSIIFRLFKVYHSSRISSLKVETADLFKATSLGTIGLFILASVFGIDIIGPLFLILFWLEITALTVLSRVILRWILGIFRRRGRNIRHVLIIGTKQRSADLARIIQRDFRLGYRFTGFVAEQDVGNVCDDIASDDIVADIERFPNFVRDHLAYIDEVWIVIPMRSYSQQISQIEMFCHELGIIVRFFPDEIDYLRKSTETEMFEGLSALTRYPSPQMGWPFLCKRCLDLSLALILFLIMSPLFICLIFLIKTTSPGPAFFIQERVGRYRRRFFIYKFRTMKENAEEELSSLENMNEFSGPAFKIRNDPRLTRLGRFLRRTSVDELPQLVNILKGEMSLVGPRPLPVRDYERFYEDKHYRRFSVLPGLTCLWQSKGRNSIPFDRWMELDLQYIDLWSFWLDIKILWKTVPSVIRGTGAS